MTAAVEALVLLFRAESREEGYSSRLSGAPLSPHPSSPYWRMSARLAPFLQASTFAFRSFPLLFRLPLAFAPLGNKRHHHHHHL